AQPIRIVPAPGQNAPGRSDHVSAGSADPLLPHPERRRQNRHLHLENHFLSLIFPTQRLTMSLSPLSPAQAENLMKLGARLIDVRAADAHARTSIPGAENIPLDQLSARSLNQPEHQAVIFHCQSGLRTTTSASVLQASTNTVAYVLEGGIDNWRKQGLPV